jgi:hypothetical protein
MSHNLLPISLTDAARRLEVEPFELVRLVVAAGIDGSTLEFNAEQLAELRTFGGIEAWWTKKRPPVDEKPQRGVLRGAISELLARKYVGDARTRQDNLWRGLGEDHRRFLEEALDVMVEHGLISVRSEASGVLVAARPEALDRLQSIAAGKDVPDDLSRLWS